MLPAFVVLGGAALTVATVMAPMAWHHVVASLFQAGTAFLGSCVLGLLLSIKLP